MTHRAVRKRWVAGVAAVALTSIGAGVLIASRTVHEKTVTPSVNASPATLLHTADSVPPRPSSKAPQSLAGKSSIPSRAFAQESLAALTSSPTLAASRWMDLADRRPNAIMGAIAAAERRGWKPTSRAARFESKGRTGAKSGRMPVALSLAQDLYASSGEGEMLVWDWNDGNPGTAEGTVWAHSYITGNEVTFNIQFEGDTYDTSIDIYYEGVDAEMTDTGLNYASFSDAPVFSGRFQLTQVTNTGQCEARGEAEGARCIARAARDYIREGVRSAAASAAVGGVVGAWAGSAGGPVGSLAGGLSGAGASAGPGFAAGVIYALVWGVDHHCIDEARRVRDYCIQQMEECNLHHTRAACEDFER